VSRPDEAEKRFIDGLNCAQAILTTYGPALGLNEGLAIRLGAALGGGIGHTGGTCGAVNGGCLILSLAYASADKAGPRKTPIDMAKRFIDLFEKEKGSVDCIDLLGCSIKTEEELARARDEGVFRARCPQFVRAAAEILDELF